MLFPHRHINVQCIYNDRVDCVTFVCLSEIFSNGIHLFTTLFSFSHSILLLFVLSFSCHSDMCWCCYESLFVSVKMLTKEGPREIKFLKILKRLSTFMLQIESWIASLPWSLCWSFLYLGLLWRSSSLLLFIIQIIYPLLYLSMSYELITLISLLISWY